MYFKINIWTKISFMKRNPNENRISIFLGLLGASNRKTNLRYIIYLKYGEVCSWRFLLRRFVRLFHCEVCSFLILRLKNYFNSLVWWKSIINQHRSTVCLWREMGPREKLLLGDFIMVCTFSLVIYSLCVILENIFHFIGLVFRCQ